MMALVTRGLGRASQLLVTFGLGVGAAVGGVPPGEPAGAVVSDKRYVVAADDLGLSAVAADDGYIGTIGTIADGGLSASAAGGRSASAAACGGSASATGGLSASATGGRSASTTSGQRSASASSSNLGAE